MPTIPTFSNGAVSLWQSAIHAVMLRHDPAAASRLSAESAPMTQAVATAAVALPEAAPRSAPPPSTVDALADVATRLALALFRGDDQRAAAIRQEFAYGQLDPFWMKCVAEYKKALLVREEVPYRRYDPARIATDFVLPLPDPAGGELVIALISDWGTGTADARALLAAAARHTPDLLIHLGDIYYSGTAEECQHHFADPIAAQWPDAAGAAPLVFTLCGNHDLYAGGAGYYQLLNQIGQPASYFCLRNDSWQILALDTGLHEHDPLTAHSCLTFLDPNEVLWHQEKLLHSGGRKTIVLSHHQLFGAVGGGVGQDAAGRALAVNPQLLAVFSQNGVSLQDVNLWLWGHEHNLIVYEPYAGLARGRCVGAGAIPVNCADTPYTPNPALQPPPDMPALPQIKQEVQLGHDDEVYYRCYAVLTLVGPRARMDYYQFDVDSGTEALLFSEDVG